MRTQRGVHRALSCRPLLPPHPTAPLRLPRAPAPSGLTPVRLEMCGELRSLPDVSGMPPRVGSISRVGLRSPALRGMGSHASSLVRRRPVAWIWGAEGWAPAGLCL